MKDGHKLLNNNLISCGAYKLRSFFVLLYVCGALVDIDNGVLLNLLEDNKLTTMQKAIKNNPIICVTRDTNFKISSAFRIMLLPTSQLLS